MHTEPTDAHRWLQRLVGTWTFEMDCPATPPAQEGAPAGEAPSESCLAPGREVVRSLGGLWVIAEGRAGSGKDAWDSVMTLGYDPARGRFVGTFIASMMAHLWVYEGSLDPAGQVLTLDADGPAFDGSGMAKYQDRISIDPAGLRTLTSQFLGPDGKWTQFMSATYRRA